MSEDARFEDGREAPLRFRIPGIVDADGAEHYAPGRLLDLEAIYHAREAEAEGVAARLDSMEAFRREMEAEAPAAQLADRAGVARETARGRLDPLETLFQLDDSPGGCRLALRVATGPYGASRR